MAFEADLLVDYPDSWQRFLAEIASYYSIPSYTAPAQDDQRPPRFPLLAADTLVGAASDYLHGDAIQHGGLTWTCGQGQDYVRTGDDTGVAQGRNGYNKLAQVDVGVLSQHVSVDTFYSAVVNQPNRYGGLAIRGNSVTDTIFVAPYGVAGHATLSARWWLGKRAPAGTDQLVGGDYFTGPELFDQQWYTIEAWAVGNVITVAIDGVVYHEHELTGTDVDDYGVSSTATNVGLFSVGYAASEGQRLRNFKCWRTYGGQ